MKNSLDPFLSSLLFHKFFRKNSMYLGCKHIENGLGCSHKLATFLNYHMPLTKFLLVQEHVIFEESNKFT